jgi:acetyltransferase-like isoleucine patch superfamily enzyme
MSSDQSPWLQLKIRSYNFKKKVFRLLGKKTEHADIRFIDNSIGTGCNLGSAVLQGHCVVGNRVRLVGDVMIGKYTTIGEGGVLYGGKINVGNYCQFGPRIGIYSINHPLDHITTYVNQHLFGGDLKTLVLTQPVRIENDVWIGDGAIILPGVIIGNGAIIGAGAVVTNNIEPYSVVVGNPARVIRKRFSDAIIDLLNNWEWWNLEPAALEDYRSVFFISSQKNPEEFMDILTNIVHKSAKS